MRVIKLVCLEAWRQELYFRWADLYRVRFSRDLVLCFSHSRAQLYIYRFLMPSVCHGCNDWGLIMCAVRGASVSNEDER